MTQTLANRAFSQFDRNGEVLRAQFTLSLAEAELRRFRRWRVMQVGSVFSEGPADLLHPDLCLALYSRETNMRNVIGGGYFEDIKDAAGNVIDKRWIQTGVDRGLGQLNEHYHGKWLKSVPGCESGTYDEIYDPVEGGALFAGRVPGLTRGAIKTRSILRYNCTYAHSRGVADDDLLMVALCGYNGGVGSAINAYLAGKDPNSITTGKDYGRDVLDRRGSIGRARRRMGWDYEREG